MYIVAMAWLFVIIVVSVAQASGLTAVLTFLFGGILPLLLLLWLIGTPARRRHKEVREAATNSLSTSALAADLASLKQTSAQPVQDNRECDCSETR